MKRLSDFNIGTRLTAGFALLLLFMAAITVVATTSMSANQARMDEITGVNNMKARAAITMRDTVHERMVALRNIALVASAAEMDDEAARIRKEAEQYAQVERKLLALLSPDPAASAEERAILKEIRQFEIKAGPLIEKAIGMSRANQIDQVYATLATELKPVQLNWMALLSRLVELEDKYNQRATMQAQAASHAARVGILVMGLIAGIAGIAVSYLLTRSLIRQLGGEPAYTAGVAAQIARGELAGDIVLRKGDGVSLLHAVATMRENLARIVGRVRANTQVIASASTEIAAGNQELASRTEQQVTALKAMAESIAELASTVRKNAESAQIADTLAITASEVASRGRDVVGEVELKMQTISASAGKISDIIGVIDGIAFQTNILALNAAVEAARAGEQGRGFAVVASEVRTLAQRSASAAREIKTLITDSVSQVQAGSELVCDAQRTMQDILHSVRRVTDLMSEISAATAAQSGGIDHINHAAAEIEGVTSQNAMLVQEAAAAAGSLHQQSRQLAELVAVFQLESGDDPGMTAVHAHAGHSSSPALSRRNKLTAH